MNNRQELPPDWSRGDLVNIAQVIDPHPSHRAPDEEKDGIPFAGIGDLDEQGEIVTESVRRVSSRVLTEHASRYTLSGNSIGFGRVASIGKVIDFQESASGIAISPTMAVIEPKSIDRKYLVHALRSNYVRGQIDRLLTGTTRSSLGIELLRGLSIPMPPNGEPEKVGLILTAVDNAILQTGALIDKYQQIKAGLMHDLFTRGVTPDGHLRPTRAEAPHLYKDSPLGWIPKEWEVRRLESVSEVSRGKFTVRPRNDPRFYGGTYPFIQTGDVALATGRILGRYSQSLNERGLSVSRLFPPGTIMVTIAANIADTCILGVPMCAPDSLVGVQPKVAGDARFIELSIRWRKSWLESRAPQTAQRNINLEDLRPLLIWWPDEYERAKISEIYETQDAAITSCESQLEKLKKEKQGLMHDLLTGRVRVKVLEPA